jgi:hypothetical protein
MPPEDSTTFGGWRRSIMGETFKNPHNAKVTLSQFQKGVKLGKRKALEETAMNPQELNERS